LAGNGKRVGTDAFSLRLPEEGLYGYPSGGFGGVPGTAGGAEFALFSPFEVEGSAPFAGGIGDR
jgi:hypothetical protein